MPIILTSTKQRVVAGGGARKVWPIRGVGAGRREWLELAFDRAPLVPAAAAGPQVVNEGGCLTLTIAKRAGVTYLGQSAATPEDAAFSPLTTTVITDSATTLKVRDNFPISTGGQRFLRAKVTAVP